MKHINVGIMPFDEFKQRSLEIASGRRKTKAGEPKIWFNSIKSFTEVLSDNNVRLLKMIADQKPASIKELETMSGRKSSNLSRTLKTFERYGLVELKKTAGSRRIMPVAKVSGVRLDYEWECHK